MSTYYKNFYLNIYKNHEIFTFFTNGCILSYKRMYKFRIPNIDLTFVKLTLFWGFIYTDSIQLNKLTYYVRNAHICFQI